MDANDRLTKLGFSPQKELVYDRLLPYADKLDDESSQQLAVIKANLGTAIQLRDLKIGATHWTCQLTKYIRIQGYKFSKEDHVLFIRLLFELLTVPDLDFSLVQKYAQLLVTLLKKKDLLTRDDLVLPWRPLYKLVSDIVYCPYEHHGLVLFPANIENVVKNVVRVSRVYFPIEATQEMLDEWRPLLCPFDVTMMRAMSYFELFLPTSLPPEHHDHGYKLWFDEFIQIWDSCQNSPSWEARLVALFARLTYGALGYVDWQPYMSKIFTRFLRSFNLPVGSGTIQVSRNGSCYDVIPMAWWIVSMLGGGSTCQDHLNRLFKSLESFYHPSNAGKWNMKLMKLMLKLPQNMLRRLYRERDKKTWFPNVEEASRLTDSDVTEFVKCLQPIVLLAMFSKTGLHDPAATIQYLAALDVKSILPPLLERTYPALETLVEPHRLISCLHCTVSGARSMLSNHTTYPEGRLHVIPLLCLSLPGIDSNDCKKCLMTFQLISTLVCLVPMVDCSSAIEERSDLTEDEKELCMVTTQFEDFVAQFMHKLFDLIENCAQEHMSSVTHKKLNQEEMIVEAGLLSAFNAVVQQSSEKIYLMVLTKLQNYISSTVHELVVAGRYTADLLRTIIKVNPEKGLKTFIMQFIDTLKTWCAANEDVAKEEHLDNDFLWNLKMLSEIVQCDGAALLPYQEELISVLRLTLDLKCKEAADLAGVLLKNLLKAVTFTFTLDYRNTPTDWNLPFKQQLPIRDWGRKGDLKDLQMKWHIPSSQEKEFAREVLRTFLLPQLQKVNDYVKVEDDTATDTDTDMTPTMTRDELLRCLTIIEHCLLGAACLLPVLQGDQMPLIESLVELKRFDNLAAVDTESVDVDGQNTRQLVVDALRPLLEYLLHKHEDDTKSLIAITKVYNCVLFNYGMPKEEFDGKWKSFFYYKKSMENKLLGKKNHMRALLVDRVQLQHEMRLVNRAAKVVTPSHVSLLQDLFRLSISRYSEVRKVGQRNLSHAFALFAYSNRAVLDDIIHCLREDSTDSELHHQFKGALYVILGENKSSLITKRSWDVMNRLWPRLVQAQHSEKPSDLQLVDTIIDKLHKNIETTELATKCHDSLLAVAGELWSSGNVPRPATPKPCVSELEMGHQKEEERNACSLKSYEKLMKALGDIVESGSLRWKFHEIAMEMLSLLVRHDTPCSPLTVRIFVKNTVHDSLQIRKLCVGTLSAILKAQKRRHKLQEIDPYQVSGVTRPSDPNTVHPGDRPDNMWMHYDPSDQPYASKDTWDSQVLVEKTHWGYYCWPTPMYVYAPEAEQPPLGREIGDLSGGERVVYAHFSKPEFVSKFFRFMSQEENKGKDKFHPKVFTLFKGLFRNFDVAFLPLMKPHIERMVQDTSRDTHDSNQRCAAEFIAGLVRGSKHWNYDMLQAMWEWLLPVLKTALSNMTVETISDWGTCFATSTESRDPRKLAPFLQLVVDNPLCGDGGSFGDSSRLYVLQGALAQQEWRVPRMLHQLLAYLTSHMAHPYKNVRDRLGSLLVNIFLYDFVLPGGGESLSPQRAPFLDQLAEQLSFLQYAESENGAANGGDNKLGGTDGSTPAETATGETASAETAQDEVSADTATAETAPVETTPEETAPVETAPAETVPAETAPIETASVVSAPAETAPAVTPSVETARAETTSVETVPAGQAAGESMPFVPTEDTGSGQNGSVDGGSDERKKAIRTCKTLLRWFQGSFSRMFNCVPPQVFKFIPIICALSSERQDDELKYDCRVTLACMAQAMLPPDVIPVLLSTISQVSMMSSWHARAAILNYTQVMVFGNLFMLQQPHFVHEIQQLVLRLLQDDQVEVREKAAVTLSGFLQCGYLKVDLELVGEFEKWSSRRLKKKHSDTVLPEDLRHRHAGVLGLSAVVQAFPYDVPQLMPQVLMTLSEHVSDPQPIQTTVKRTLLNFKRTHLDNWNDHKNMFTDDQLVILTDLLVSPNYYA